MPVSTHWPSLLSFFLIYTCFITFHYLKPWLSTAQTKRLFRGSGFTSNLHLYLLPHLSERDRSTVRWQPSCGDMLTKRCGSVDDQLCWVQPAFQTAINQTRIQGRKTIRGQTVPVMDRLQACDDSRGSFNVTDSFNVVSIGDLDAQIQSQPITIVHRLECDIYCLSESGALVTKSWCPECGPLKPDVALV